MVLFLLNANLADLDGTWLRVTCCRGVAYLPLRGLARRHPRARLGEVIPRLRCQACHGRLYGLAVVENPAGDGSAIGGPPAGWVIGLL